MLKGLVELVDYSILFYINLGTLVVELGYVCVFVHIKC